MTFATGPDDIAWGNPRCECSKLRKDNARLLALLREARGYVFNYACIDGPTKKSDREREMADARDLLARIDAEIGETREDHAFVGDDFDCGLCGEGIQFYAHTDRDTSDDTPGDE